MKKLYRRFTRLVFKFNDANDPGGIEKQPFHLNYDSGRYREDELVHVIRGALPHFALTPEEYYRLKNDDEIDEMYRLALSRISKAKKKQKR